MIEIVIKDIPRTSLGNRIVDVWEKGGWTAYFGDRHSRLRVWLHRP